MTTSGKSDKDSGLMLGLLALFVLVQGLCDFVTISHLSDSFLPPPALPDGLPWSELGDRSVTICYPSDWKLVLSHWASRYFSDTAVTVVVVLAAHALLWSGVYCFGRALFGGSSWVALLGVLLVRICPDLFQVGLLSAGAPSRLMAVAFAFWSTALTMRRQWLAACCAAALIAHLLPTAGCWFGQFVVAAMFCLNYEWGWRRSLLGLACYVAIAAKPLAEFFATDVVPPAPIPSDAMIGLHIFADPTLSPLSVPLWAYVCLVVYLAMAMIWLKQHFNRRTTPVVIIFFLMGMAMTVLEIILVGLLDVERAARFELQNMRAFWLLWIAIFYAPALAEAIRTSWHNRRGAAWPIFQGLAFSMAPVWSALTLLSRLRQPPRWNPVVVGAMLCLLGASMFVFSSGSRPVEAALHAAVIALVLTVAALVAVFVTKGAFRASCAYGARSIACSVGIFAVIFVLVDGGNLLRHIGQIRQTVLRHAQWQQICRGPASQGPSNSVWAIPWRPRQFRRLTGRPVLVSRNEIPRQPSSRLEWFYDYAETHGWPGGLHTPSHVQSPTSRLPTRALVEWLQTYRCSLLFGAARQRDIALDWVVVSSLLARVHHVQFIVCEADRPPVVVHDKELIRLVHLSQPTEAGPFDLYEVQTKSAEPQ